MLDGRACTAQMYIRRPGIEAGVEGQPIFGEATRLICIYIYTNRGARVRMRRYAGRHGRVHARARMFLFAIARDYQLAIYKPRRMEGIYRP